MLSAAVLAAGLSTRMGGRSKALLRFDERDSFVTRIVRTFNEAGIRNVVVVVGHEADAVRRAVSASGLSATCLVNEDYRCGQLSSLLVAVGHAERSGAEGLALALVDAPMFAASTVRALTAAFERDAVPVLRPVRGHEHGHPILVGRSLFVALRAADPELGAKPVIRANVSARGDIEVDDAGAFIDIDTPDDYARILGEPVPPTSPTADR